MLTIRERLGMLRSIAAYYWKPFNKRRLMRFYSQFVNPNSLCFDIGAHVGNRTNAWEALGAKVVAVEPQPICMNYLRKRFKGKDSINLLECAVGEKSGTAKMFVSEMTPTVSTLSHKSWRDTINEDTSFEVKWENQIDVKVVTLDTLIDQYGIPNFCKIDVENFELEVLKGLSQPIPCLSVEFYPATIDNAIKCIERLEQLGHYKYNWSTAESQQFNAAEWLSAEKMISIFSKYKRDDKYGDFYAIL
ncbi:MAG: FkbM family methyltransferase [Bacteroidota bacterium]